MTRLSLLSLLAAFTAAASAQDPPKADPPKADPPKTDPDKPVAKPDDGVIVNKFNAGDVMGTVASVTDSQLTLKIPQQVPNGFTTQNVRVPNPVKPGHPQTYHTVRQQVPKFKTVQVEQTFDLGSKVTVKTESGRVSDMSAVTPGTPVVAHLTKVKEGKPGEKADVHVEVTRILIPNQSAPPSGSSGSGSDPKKKD